MPKNKGKGGKNNRKNKNEVAVKRDLVLKEKGQEYGQVTKLLGDCRVECDCFDGQKRQCHIRGKMKKRCWLNPGDIVLVDLRDFQSDKSDILLKYTPADVHQMKHLNLLPNTMTVNEQQNYNAFEFMSGSSASGEIVMPQPDIRGQDYADETESSSDVDICQL